MPYRSVIFDIGGVVVGSPLQAIAEYERERELPEGLVNRTVIETGPSGAWSRLERGELTMDEFFVCFDGECAHAGPGFSAREMMMRIAAVTVPRPQVLEAIRRIREHGLATAALTNNWASDEPGARMLDSHFDVFVESSVEGLRKPDPRIYQLACDRLGVLPSESVFLDDIGRNLKTARELGMTTIRVVDPDAALDELTSVLGFPLR